MRGRSSGEYACAVPITSGYHRGRIQPAMSHDDGASAILVGRFIEQVTRNDESKATRVFPRGSEASMPEVKSI